MNQNREIKRLKKEIERLRKLVYRDELTGLFNRRGFKDIAQKTFDEVLLSRKKHGEKRKSIKLRSFSILFIDLDHFKRINDDYGHDAGDKALSLIAKVLSQRLRKIDIIARWGGEEFIVGLLETDAKKAYKVALDILKRVSSTPLVLNGKRIYLTVSIGVASLSNEKKLSELINLADKAMYLAKKGGRNRVVLIEK
jgi:diguanylate cyclase (GGDEF)-like protein